MAMQQHVYNIHQLRLCNYTVHQERRRDFAKSNNSGIHSSGLADLLLIIEKAD